MGVTRTHFTLPSVTLDKGKLFPPNIHYQYLDLCALCACFFNSVAQTVSMQEPTIQRGSKIDVRVYNSGHFVLRTPGRIYKHTKERIRQEDELRCMRCPFHPY